jgi:CBS domain-containing protein
MTIGTVCSRNVCVSRLGAALAGAVESMSKHHVGAIVVVDERTPVKENCEIAEGVAAMSRRGVRRAPVVDEGGSLVGIVSMDDLLSALSYDLSSLAGLIKAQPAYEA